ncbi:hypothetical protein TCAL_14281 [Tigriopus californicus]|uniref:Uncharacterized protein n=2 Tax=Tigriopus californicus TaxID=6832 RepID=A0A553NT65_TIGCA|nr:hypothetical protein TCAL_14281 [Tigriopus californicus]
MEPILEGLTVESERLYKEHKFKEVEEMFSTFLKEAVGEKPEIRAQALNNRGHAKYMQVKFDEALVDYEESIVLAKTIPATFYNRATIKFRMGKFDEALPDFEEAATQAPQNEEFQEGLAKCRSAAKE